MINYILQVILFQVLFLAIYDFFLSKETFFTKNRWYLLSTPVLSFIIPFIKIPSFQKAVPQEFIVYLPEIFLSPEKAIQQTFQESMLQSSMNVFSMLFWIGVSIFSLIFMIKLIKIINLIRKNEIVKKSDFTLILLPKASKAFSFFRYIFLGKEIPKKQQEKVIEHELVHSKQNHSLDLLLFEVLKIIMWFNPMIYFYQRRITLVHEYISDAIVAKSEEKETYINSLLSNFFQVENISFINQFYKQSLIKKRIIMMTKNKSKKTNQLKYLLLIPVLLSMLIYVSCTTEEIEKPLNKKERIKEIIEELEMLKSEVSTGMFDEIVLKNNKFLSSEKEFVFSKIKKSPTFPGCETGDKNCFSTMIQKHFFKKFNTKLPNQLGLSSGRKKVYIQFKIDKDGNIVDIKAKAPHEDIKNEVISVMSSLPKMIPGELKDGQKVAVKYNIPFTILVE